jgi:hypothetical protein
VIVRALIHSAVQQVPGAGTLDASARRSLAAFARAFVLKDTAVDPADGFLGPTAVCQSVGSWSCDGLDAAESLMQMTDDDFCEALDFVVGRHVAIGHDADRDVAVMLDDVDRAVVKRYFGAEPGDVFG